MSISGIIQNLGRTINTNSPVILTGLGVAGVVGTTLLAVKATFKSAEDIWALEERTHEVAPIKEKLLTVWPNYIPTVGSGIVTVACILGAQSINSRRNAALISAYTASTSFWKDYQEKVVEQVGKKKDQSIRDDIARDRMVSDPSSGKEIVVIGSGESLCYDPLTSRYFMSDMETIRKAVNDINLQCINEMYASQNEFYDKIGLPHADIGETLGWTTSNPIELAYSAVLSDTGKPCIALSYRKDPITHFHKVF